MLQGKVTQLSTDFGRLVGEVSALRSAAAGIQTLWEVVSAVKIQIAQKLNDPVVEQLSTEFIELRNEVSALWRFPAAPQFDSRIISDFPEIFAEFRGKRFSLLWRGSRDGFKAQEFHRRCDGHSNTLTVILDTKRNILGGFTPVEWESRVHNGEYGGDDNRLKADDSLRSFIFTLQNPHNIPAKRFALKAYRTQYAIFCDPRWGPGFGYGDFRVDDNCNANTDSWSALGNNYINDTGLGDGIVLAGSKNFQVTEIEVFAITA
jgi:hypothetical protein